MDLPSLDDLDDDALAAAYDRPRTPWLRLNFVSSVDGAVQGDDGLSRSLNNEADERVFQALRRLADVVVVGAQTVRAEEYEANRTPMVVVSRSGRITDQVAEGGHARVVLATTADCPRLAEVREQLGEDDVWVLGEGSVDPHALRERLLAEGYADILCEGGPHLARELLEAGVVDELCVTTVPTVIAGDHLRLAAGAPVDVPLRLHGLIAAGDTLLARWFVSGPVSG